MDFTIRNIVMVLSVPLMIALAVVTILAMVIAPPASGIMQLAGAYKIGSLLVFIPPYYYLVWRKRFAAFAVLIPVLQIAAGWSFATYLNTLPIGLPVGH